MKKFISVVLWSLALALCSCTTTYYIPNTQHIPIIDEKAKTSTVAGNGNQAEFQAAYGVGESVAIMANGVVVFPQDEYNGNGGSGRLVDLGVGYFKPLSENWLFDTYAIVGFEKLKIASPELLQNSQSLQTIIRQIYGAMAYSPRCAITPRFFQLTVLRVS